MKSVSCPDSVDEAERTEVGGSEHQSDHVEGLEIYKLTLLTAHR